MSGGFINVSRSKDGHRFQKNHDPLKTPRYEAGLRKGDQSHGKPYIKERERQTTVPVTLVFQSMTGRARDAQRVMIDKIVGIIGGGRRIEDVIHADITHDTHANSVG